MCSRRMTARVVQLKTHLHLCLSLVPRQITVFSDSWSGLLNPGSNKSPWSNLITVCLCVSVALMGTSWKWGWDDKWIFSFYSFLLFFTSGGVTSATCLCSRHHQHPSSASEKLLSVPGKCLHQFRSSSFRSSWWCLDNEEATAISILEGTPTETRKL